MRIEENDFFSKVLQCKTEENGEKENLKKNELGVMENEKTNMYK